ncbi:hypothetical protein SPRG_01657 [Saprolegnia parasitica CBS 223.65]|uniref:Uncharacterized protein n=1 Tax=Saprolegnia parasitica (strain CBS 223.65) TaxID=695850 RepID=A0A067D432_SAPPC|nr:hypothetical protein SPRG_01657 [Saprolegnia parasitica CBS 223.65]KDO33777.1 hypothetical protein SPRG_01657 [Saprolegnia parasitica CBS 223.65]|eukprot:XP_012195414.1 hypothetical protein SPRG_01657 [Saprolegnia parasitica CBS 223.65]
MSSLPPSSSSLSSPPKLPTLCDYVALAQPEVAKPSPYAARFKRKRKKAPAVLAPLLKNGSSHAYIGVAESRVVKAILTRADLVQELRLLCQEMASTRELELESAKRELATRLGDATNAVVLALNEWRAAKLETAAHASVQVTPSFRWQGAPYLQTLARETKDIHVLLNVSTPPNPFFTPCGLEAATDRYQVAAESLLRDADFLTGWRPPRSQHAEEHVMPTTSLLDHALGALSPAAIAQIQTTVHPPRGLRCVTDAITSLVSMSFYETPPRELLHRLRAMHQTTSSALTEVAAALLGETAWLPSALLRESLNMAQLSFWLLQLLLQHRRCASTKPLERPTARCCEPSIRRAVRLDGRLYMARLHKSSDSAITLCSPNGQVFTHTLHAADGRSMVTQPARLDAYLARLQPLVFTAPLCDAAPSLHLVGVHGTDTIVASIDLTVTSSFADVRRYLFDLPKVPPTYAFLYRGSILGRALESRRRPWCSTAPPRRIDIQLQTRQATRRHVFISDMDRDAAKRDEARRRRAPVVSPPRTHCTFTLHLDIPSAVVTVQMRTTFSTTLEEILNALQSEHGIDAASSHDVFVLSAPETILPLTARLSACNLGHGSVLGLRHKRVDVVLACAGTLTLLLSQDTLVCSHRAMTQARFGHWQLSPGDTLALRGDTYTVTKVNTAASTLTVHPAVSIDDRFDLVATKHLRQVLVDPRFPWEVDGRIDAYLASHVPTTATTTQFRVELCTSTLLDALASQRHLVHAAVQTLPLDVCVGVLYDDLCNAFPITHGVTNVKFSSFLKSYRLHAVLLLTSAASVHAYFSLHVRPRQASLLLPDWKACLVAIAHSTYKHLPNAHPPPKTPNEAIAFSFTHGSSCTAH